MKKLIVAVLLICIFLNLCACGKSEEAQHVDDLILSIGEVTLATKSNINNVREQYEMLSDKQQQQVENYHILEDAIEALSILEAKQAMIEENYLKVYNWMVDNGKEIIETDVNNYGDVLQYEYIFKSSVGNIPIRFDRVDNGEFTLLTHLSVFHSYIPGEFDPDIGNLYELNSYVAIYPYNSNLSYVWEYGGINVFISKELELAQGFIEVDDISQLSSSGSD